MSGEMAFCTLCSWSGEIGAKAHAAVIHGEAAIAVEQMGHTFVVRNPNDALAAITAIRGAALSGSTAPEEPDDIAEFARQTYMNGYRQGLKESGSTAPLDRPYPTRCGAMWCDRRVGHEGQHVLVRLSPAASPDPAQGGETRG